MITAYGAEKLTQDALILNELERIKRLEKLEKSKQEVRESTIHYCENTLSDMINDTAKTGNSTITIKFSRIYSDEMCSEASRRYVLKDEGARYADGRHSEEPNSKLGAINFDFLIEILKKFNYKITIEEYSYWEYFLGKLTGRKLIISWAK